MTTPTSPYRLEKCPFCGDDLTTTDHDGYCAQCKAPPRTRSITYVARNVVAPAYKPGKGLVFSPSSLELQALSPLNCEMTNMDIASLYGSYGKDTKIVDIRKLEQYKNNSLTLIYSCGVLDYVIEHEAAISEAARALQGGGIFMTHILPYRLNESDESPEVAYFIHGRPGYFEYLNDVELPSIKVGKNWFLRKMREHGFDAKSVEVTDPSGVISTWFVGVK